VKAYFERKAEMRNLMGITKGKTAPEFHFTKQTPTHLKAPMNTQSPAEV